VTITVLPGAGGWPEDDPPPRPEPPLIELSGLRLPSGPAPLLDLIVPRGEMIMLTGQPRSGRSALLNVLGLLDRPAAGSYRLNGIDTGKLRDRDRSALRGREIGFVFQRKMVLPTRSVLDNVMLPLRYAGMSRRRRLGAAIESLDRVGLGDAARLMAWQLSADELALCAVARALVARPSLVLCDEPTAGLDQSTATQVIGVLASLHREGGTVLVATADQLAAAYSSRSVRLDPVAGPWSGTELSVAQQMRLPLTDSPQDTARLIDPAP
jgi:putative ABC transport system ATP-binding protein